MFHFPYALIIGLLLFLLMSSVAGGYGERTIGVCEGIKDPNIEKCTLSIILPKSLSLDVDTSSVLSVSGVVV